MLGAEIAGYPVVLKIDSPAAWPYEGARVAYFPQGLHIPEYVARQFGVNTYLTSKGVVRTVRLRGHLSYGLALPLTKDLAFLAERPVGDVVDDLFGTEKYNPPISEAMYQTGIIDSEPSFQRFTDIERINPVFGVLANYFAENSIDVMVTEKINGASVRVGMVGGKLIAGSRQHQRARPETEQGMKSNWYWHTTTNENILELLTNISQDGQKDVILFGETFGKGVTKGKGKMAYGRDYLDFRAFDLMINGVYVDADQFLRLMRAYSIPVAPIDYTGKFDAEVFRGLASAMSQLTTKHHREGVVIRPMREVFLPQIGRVIVKLINPVHDVNVSDGTVEDFTDA